MSQIGDMRLRPNLQLLHMGNRIVIKWCGEPHPTGSHLRRVQSTPASLKTASGSVALRGQHPVYHIAMNLNNTEHAM
jgi:hypothetical protein